MHSHAQNWWLPWPDHEEFSIEFSRLVRALQDVSGTVAECRAVGGRIAAGNTEDWYQAWKGQAKACKARAGRAFAQGFFQTAKAKWLQASAYYRSAGAFLAVNDRRCRKIHFEIEKCSELYIGCMNPVGEFVQMRCGHNRPFRGFFLKAPDAPRLGSAVICFGGPGESADELLGKMPRFAFARRLSLMIVGLPGIGDREPNSLACCSAEAIVGRCMSYLLGRGDIDENRIALFGNNFGAVYASRIASSDHRFAAAVCDGGIWDDSTKPLLTSWAFGERVGRSTHAKTRKIPRYGTARRIKCPFLVTSAEHEFLDKGDVVGLYNLCSKARMQMDIKWFSVDDAGEPRKRFVFDWLATKLGC